MVSNKKLHDLCVAFRKLGNQEFQIFEYIYNDCFKKFDGNYSDLARAVDSNPSATRKAVLKLKQYGVLNISDNRFTNKPIIFIAANWENNLIANTVNVSNPLENIKRPRNK